jgi:cysteine desulfurase
VTATDGHRPGNENGEGDRTGRGGSAGIYLDWNATTPPHPAVLEAMTRAAAETWGNPSSVHATGRAAWAVIERARRAVAELCGADARDVILTSGATEANNLALRHAPALVTSRLEHPSVTRVAEALMDEGRPVRWAGVLPSGQIDVPGLARLLPQLPAGFVVAVMAASHETGVLQPVAEVAELVRACGGRLHVDAVQAAGKVVPEAFQHGDSISIAAHKIRGPKGIGALVLRSPGVPRPVLLGGAQERGIRPGTVDPVGAAGFAAAVERALVDGPTRYALLAPLRDRLERALGEYASVNGVQASRLPHVSSLAFQGFEGESFVAALDLDGIRVSSGSACSAGTSEPSPAIEAMLGKDRARATVRFSLGETTTASEIDSAIAAAIQILTRQTSIG